MYKIIYLQRALDDLDDIHLYITNDNLKAANKMVNDILDAIGTLETFPFAGSSVSDRLDLKGNYRMIVVKPYLVFYRVTNKQITIYRVLHNKRYHSALLE